MRGNALFVKSLSSRKLQMKQLTKPVSLAAVGHDLKGTPGPLKGPLIISLYVVDGVLL